MPLFVFVASSGSTHSVNGETLRSNRNRLKEWAILIGPAALLVTLDQVSKWLVRQNLAVGEMWAPIPALSKIFTFTHVQNTGVSFGQLPGLGWLFMLVNLAVVVGILIYYPRIPAGQWKLRLALALLLVGALGNWIDRLRTAFLIAGQTGSFWTALPQASVTDFMDFKIWPVWNLADLCTVTGVIILAWSLWQAERAEMHKESVSHDA
jgi:signal peptidase II